MALKFASFSKPELNTHLTYLFPILLVIAATLVKFYAFSSIGYKIPMILYALVICISAIVMGRISAAIAAAASLVASLGILAFPELFLNIPNHELSLTALSSIGLVWLALLFYSYSKSLKISREKEAHFEFLADSVPGKVWTANSQMIANYYNKDWYEFTGKSSMEEIRNIVWELIHPDDLPKVMAAAQANLASSTPYEVEHRFKNKQGDYRWHLSKSKPLIDEDGKVKLWIGTCIDIQHQKQDLEASASREKYYRFLADNSPIIIWQTDMNGTVNYISKQWENYSGTSLTDTLDRGWKIRLHPDDVSRQENLYQECLAQRKFYSTKFRLERADGQYRWFLSIGEPVFDGSVGYLGSLTDITDEENAQQQSEMQLRKMDEFVSIASHELKTPLTSLKLYLQIIQKTKTPEQENFITRGLEQLKRLERLTSDLLDVSKISAGKLVYDIQDINFNELLQEFVEIAQNTSKKHRIVLQSNTSVKLSGDRHRLEQVLANIISNAIKYSPESDTILVNSNVKGNFVVVSVQDFGIGIQREDLAKIFQRFYRVDATAMKYEGLGLGLFIVSEILIRHSGDFWIESEPGKGSTFFFKLPLTENQRNISADQSDRYEDEGISIIYNKEQHLLEVDWKGFQDFESVKYGCLKMYAILKNTKCSLILNDNTNITGASDAAEWVGGVWFPMMEAEGLKYFAWVFSTVMFNNISAQKAVDLKQGNVVTQFFTSSEEARNWLLGAELNK